MILVTGAAGTIGRALSARLESERLPFVGMRRQDFDLSGGGSLLGAVSKCPSAVVHLAAAVPRTPESRDDQDLALSTRRMDDAVLEAVQVWRCPVIYASGCSLYAKGGAAARTEDDPLEPVPHSAYLQAKLAGEAAFLEYEEATVLRISAPLGPGLHRQAVAMRFVAAARNAGTIDVWGQGTREQNYVDTSDIADALLRALVIRPGGALNICADRPVSMLDLARSIASAVGGAEVRVGSRSDPQEGEHARYSNARASRVLSWRPQRPLTESIVRIIKHES